ncbi:MAG: dihydrolipoamide acetyltransferase family protein [Rhodospirillales bacterium]|jgi:pyruvate dehydrogenase E2 component (dihydrolipoamide acetyltransferase)|nr:dihydrolipoamide acetyltransferase family protein [Rhodospirillales bacterium]MDP7652670.1 dihydrolipoamide acetyltransferase family protein [Rhodospirillales bacterium]
MKQFTLPDLGEGLQEAEIVDWHVAVGDQVMGEQPLLSVETDKAVVEVPSPHTGRIAKLHAKTGDIVAVGAPLVDFDQGKEAYSGTVVGTMPSGEVRIDESAEPVRPGSAKVKATPAVRALARKLNVDLGAVDASGAKGQITADDINRVAQVLSEIEPPERLRGVRRVMAQKMSQSHNEVAPATLCDEADVESWPTGTDVTARLVRAIVTGCQAEPALNAWYDSTAASRRVLEKIDLGIAVDTEDGLFVPVLRDAGERDADDLRDGLVAMKKDIGARDVPPEELRGATLTLSNFGVFGAGRFAALVVLPPQVAIIGAGHIAPRVVAIDGTPGVRRMLPLSLTFDHRVVSGGEAARFLAAIIKDLEQTG